MKMWKPTLIAALSLLTIPSFAEPVELDRVIAIVNDGLILRSDIDAALMTLDHNAKENEQTLPSSEILREQVLEKLIVDTIQLQEAERLGVKIDDNSLNQAIQEIAKKKGFTVDQLQASIIKDGTEYATFREQVRKEIAISEVRNALVRRRINILPMEIEALSKQLSAQTNASVQYQIQHIQLRSDDYENNQAIEKKAKEMITKLNQGDDFATMAISYSKGPKALQGGHWGWLRKEEMPTVFADQITTQTSGAIIGPFRSGVGLHIIKIMDTKGLETVSVTEINARHILLKTSIILSDNGAKRQLNNYIHRIKSGEATFGDLAAQFSQDLSSAAQNGELGYQNPDFYVPEFKHQVETLPIAQISEPFKTVHGWHIVEVLDRRNIDKTDTVLTNKAYRILFNRKFNEEASAWMQEMRASAYVELIPDDETEE